MIDGDDYEGPSYEQEMESKLDALREEGRDPGTRIRQRAAARKSIRCFNCLRWVNAGPRLGNCAEHGTRTDAWDYCSAFTHRD